LVAKTNYTVVKVSDDLFQLKDSNGNLVQLAQGNALGTQQFVNVTTQITATVTLARIDTANDRIILQDHGFSGTSTNPMLVTYWQPVVDPADIGGLSPLTSYKLVKVDKNSFELHDINSGALIQLTDPGAGGTYALTDQHLYQITRGSIADLTIADQEIG